MGAIFYRRSPTSLVKPAGFGCCNESGRVCDCLRHGVVDRTLRLSSFTVRAIPRYSANTALRSLGPMPPSWAIFGWSRLNPWKTANNGASSLACRFLTTRVSLAGLCVISWNFWNSALDTRRAILSLVSAVSSRSSAKRASPPSNACLSLPGRGVWPAILVLCRDLLTRVASLLWGTTTNPTGGEADGARGNSPHRRFQSVPASA